MLVTAQTSTIDAACPYEAVSVSGVGPLRSLNFELAPASDVDEICQIRVEVVYCFLVVNLKNKALTHDSLVRPALLLSHPINVRMNDPHVSR